MNKILRKVVTHGTAGLSDVEGYEVGGKTGTAQIVENGVYTNKKINTFASVFPSSDPKFVLVILLEDTSFQKIMSINTEINQGLLWERHLIRQVGHL